MRKYVGQKSECLKYLWASLHACQQVCFSCLTSLISIIRHRHFCLCGPPPFFSQYSVEVQTFPIQFNGFSFFLIIIINSLITVILKHNGPSHGNSEALKHSFFLVELCNYGFLLYRTKYSTAKAHLLESNIIFCDVI